MVGGMCPGGSQLLVAVGEPVRTHREAYAVKLGIKHRVGVRLSTWAPAGTGPPDKKQDAQLHLYSDKQGLLVREDTLSQINLTKYHFMAPTGAEPRQLVHCCPPQAG